MWTPGCPMDNSEYKRLKFLLEPLHSAEELDLYLRAYFSIELPWDIVDEESTSSALKFLWDSYNFLLTGEGASKHIVAAARNTAKTLNSALFHYFSLVHFRRDGIHVAALLSQANAAIDYIDNFLRIPELTPYRNIDNFRKKMLAGLPPNDVSSRPEAVLRIVTASKKGSNSPRASTLIFDEAELIDNAVISEAAYIADPARMTNACKDPIFIYLSSRKSATGNLQVLMDGAMGSNADEKRIFLHKWSCVDWQEKCLDEVSRASEGSIKAFINTENLEIIWEKDLFDLTVSEGMRAQYKEIEAYSGCVSCPSFVACQARAPKQRGDSTMLRTRFFIGDVLENVREASAIIAQTLNWRPESTYNVFKSFAFHRHVGDANKVYEFVSGGTPFNPANLTQLELDAVLEDGTKKEIIALTPTKADIFWEMKKQGWRTVAGVDWGFSPAPSVVVVVGYHMRWKRACVLHVDFANNYANNDWAQHIKDRVYSQFPFEVVAPDMADKSSPVHFKKVQLPCINTKPARIQAGVSQIRGLLWSPISQTSNFMILDDGIEKGGNYRLIEAFQQWTHKRMAGGTYNFEDFQDDSNCDYIDPLRYALDMFIEKREGHLSISHSPTPREAAIKDMEEKAIAAREEQQKTIKTVFEETVLREMGIAVHIDAPKVPTEPDPNKDPPKRKLKFAF